MTQNYMPALLVLSDFRNRLESIGKDALIEVVNNCFELGTTEEALTKAASLALDDRAIQSSNPSVTQSPGTTTPAKRTASAKSTQKTPALRELLLTREGSSQEADIEDPSFIKNDIDIHTPFINPVNKTQAVAGRDLVTTPVKKTVQTPKREPARAKVAIEESPKVLVVRKKRMRHSDEDDTNTMVVPKRKALPRKRDKFYGQSVSSTIAVPKTKIELQGRAKPRARAAPKTSSSL